MPFSMLNVTRIRVVLFLCLLSALAGVASADTTNRVPELAFTDTQGKRYDTAGMAQNKATVFFFVSTQCPIANRYTPRFLQMAKTWMPRNVRFFLVDSNRQDDLATLKKYTAERKFPFPAVHDPGAVLADRLNAQTTPQAIVLDNAGIVRYLGRIDDNADVTRVKRRDVEEALTALLAGKPVAHPRTLAFGCTIFRDTKPVSRHAAQTVTYARDVAPILNKNCVICHRSGEVAPFALENYAQSRTWATAIKEYTARRLMPPWKPVPGYGEFHDSRWLSDKEIATLAVWADTGAPMGDAKHLPAAPKYPDPTAWKLGTPDTVLMPSGIYHLEAEGKDVYRNFVMPADFTEDRYLSAMEFQPGNRSIVHHIVTYVDTRGVSVKLDGKEKEPGYTVPGVGIGVMDAEWGEVWVPGNEPRRMPEGTAIYIPKGAKLVMQVHYHKTGKPEEDQSKMALYYAKGKPERIVHNVGIGNVFFSLKAGNPRNVVKGSFPGGLPFDITLYSVFPHMHMLGHEMHVYATLPDGTKRDLILINDWDFNWQATYYFKQPVKLPKGTKISLTAVFDNSEQNPRQPSHPPKTVSFGEQTTDEMCFAFLGLTVDDPTAESTMRARKQDAVAP